jgi:hypothetical protein
MPPITNTQEDDATGRALGVAAAGGEHGCPRPNYLPAPGRNMQHDIPCNATFLV